MIVALGGILVLVFVFLSGVHFYWAFGGKWGFKEALPTTTHGIRVLNPSTKDSIIVGLGLLFFAVFYMIKIGLLSQVFSKWVLFFGGWFLPTLFLLRVLGDFRYIGLFKKVRSTEFAKRDAKYYIPLCFFLSGAGFLVQLYSTN